MIGPIRADMNRLAWHVGTIRWPASRHGFGIDLAAVLSRGPSASIRSRPIISDPWVLKIRCIDVEAGAPQGKAASFVEWAGCAAKPHRHVCVIKVPSAAAGRAGGQLPG